MMLIRDHNFSVSTSFTSLLVIHGLFCGFSATIWSFLRGNFLEEISLIFDWFINFAYLIFLEKVIRITSCKHLINHELKASKKHSIAFTLSFKWWLMFQVSLLLYCTMTDSCCQGFSAVPKSLVLVKALCARKYNYSSNFFAWVLHFNRGSSVSFLWLVWT